MGEALVRGVAFGALYGVMAATLAIVFRATRALSFAHGEMGALAVFVALWLVERHELPWLVGGLAGMALAGTVGLGFHAGCRCLCGVSRTPVRVGGGT